jgi:hypothetical protein
MDNPYQIPKANLETTQPLEGASPRFTFKVGEDEIVCVLGLSMGREKIYLNGEQLFSKINFRRKGVHTLHLNGEDYQLVIMSDSLMKPVRSCWLEKDGVVLQKYHSVSKPRNSYFAVAVLLIVVETIYIDYLAIMRDLPTWGATGSILFFLVVLGLGMHFSQKHGSVVITEEAVPQ